MTLSDRLAYVDALVDMNAMVIEAIWPVGGYHNNIVPLRSFIQEVLKRSRTTYSTLQTAFFYLFRARPAIMKHLLLYQHKHNSNHSQQQQPLKGKDAYIHCGRRMFLASLVVASKFVQDKTYRNSAWAKIAGLPVQEINTSERVFLELLDYRLYVAQNTFHQWHQLLHAHVQAKTTLRPPSPSTSSSSIFSSNILQQKQQQQYPPTSIAALIHPNNINTTINNNNNNNNNTHSHHNINTNTTTTIHTTSNSNNNNNTTSTSTSDSSSSLPSLSPSSIISSVPSSSSLSSTASSPVLYSPLPLSFIMNPSTTKKRSRSDDDHIDVYQQGVQRKRPYHV
ncbi:hypothetical protein BJ944DRAFT_273168 [Cunninghamella echinulata]|nr:hypothetical protein BJ944DRAFT_273168 [Cunninghamella echinulata]